MLQPGAAPGTVDAEVRVADQRPYRFSVGLDNTGTKETGDLRLGLGFQHVNVFGRDHVLNLQYVRKVSGTAGRKSGAKSARDLFFYTDDDLLVAIRQGDYKYVCAEQRMAGTVGVWAEPFTELRLQKIFNLFQDPFERADITSNTFWDWQLNHIGQVYGLMEEVFKFAETFKAFPPSFNPATVLEVTMADVRRRMEAEASKSK